MPSCAARAVAVISRTAQPAMSRLGASAGSASPRAARVVHRTSWSGCAARETTTQGKSGGRPSSSHCAASRRQVATRHIDDASGILDLWQRRLIVRLRVMAGGEDDVRSAVAVGERALDRGGGCEGGGDSGDDLEGHAGVVERGHLFGGAAEDERVSALEADDAAPSAGVFDHQGVDLVLSDVLKAAALADIDDFGAGRRIFENRLRDEVVVENHVRMLDQAQGFDGEQVGVSGTCAHEIDFP